MASAPTEPWATSVTVTPSRPKLPKYLSGIQVRPQRTEAPANASTG